MKKKLYLSNIIIFIVFLFVDQITKYLSTEYLTQDITLIPGVLSFTYVRNVGVAFGMLSGKTVFIFISTFIISLFLIYLLINSLRHSEIHKYSYLLSFILVGCLGNVLDRLRFQYVVDFIHFDFINFPVFNIADVIIVIAGIVFIVFFMKETDENLNKLFKLSKKEIKKDESKKG